jgi:hypothetical protein
MELRGTERKLPHFENYTHACFAPVRGYIAYTPNNKDGEVAAIERRTIFLESSASCDTGISNPEVECLSHAARVCLKEPGHSVLCHHGNFHVLCAFFAVS